MKKNRFVVSRLLAHNEEELGRLYEDYLTGKIDFNDNASHFSLINEIYKLHENKYELQQDVIDEASKSFARQFEESAEVRKDTYLMFTMLVLTREIIIEALDLKKSKKRLRRDHNAEENENTLKRYINEIKRMVIEEGPGEITENITVEDLNVWKDEVIGKYKISLDITTSNIFELLQMIWKRKRLTGPFPYKSIQSLGQHIRYYKNSMRRQGFKIYTYKRKSTHVVVEFVLSQAESSFMDIAKKRKEWF